MGEDAGHRARTTLVKPSARANWLPRAELLERIRVMADTAEVVALTASGGAQEIGGRVTLSATDSYCAHILTAMIERIRTEAPQITTALVVANELSNLQRRDADIAIRHVPLDRLSLIGQYVRDTQAHFYAADSWLARNPRADLARHPCRTAGNTTYSSGSGHPC